MHQQAWSVDAPSSSSSNLTNSDPITHFSAIAINTGLMHGILGITLEHTFPINTHPPLRWGVAMGVAYNKEFKICYPNCITPRITMWNIPHLFYLTYPISSLHLEAGLGGKAGFYADPFTGKYRMKYNLSPLISARWHLRFTDYRLFFKLSGGWPFRITDYYTKEDLPLFLFTPLSASVGYTF
jgi:hypothetical protein